MDKARWYQMKKGMEKAGWRCVVELHPDLPQEMQQAISEDARVKFPETRFDRQWYRSHNAYLVLFVRERKPAKPDVTENKYREPIIERLDAQTLKGIEKYGSVLPQNQDPVLKRIEHVQQELTDALVYNEWISEGIVTVARHVIALRNHLHETYSKVEGMEQRNPVRQNHLKALEMANAIIKELGEVGKSK